MERKSQVQIPKDLLLALFQYHLAGNEEYLPEIEKALMEKLDSMVKRQLYTPYKPSLCLLFTGAWHAPVIRSSSRIFTNESSHAFHTYPNTLVLPFPVLPRLVLF